MKLLLDTNVLIDMLHGDKAVLALLRQASENEFEFTVSAVTVAEIYVGMRPGEETQTRLVTNSVRCLPVTREIGQRAGDIKRAWSKKGRTLSLADTMIAATALEHDVQFMTKNRKDFPEQGIVFYPAP